MRLHKDNLDLIKDKAGPFGRAIAQEVLDEIFRGDPITINNQQVDEMIAQRLREIGVVAGQTINYVLSSSGVEVLP